MTTRIFEVHVFEVDTQLEPDGTTPTLTEVRRYAVESCCADDALIALGEQLAAEEAS